MRTVFWNKLARSDYYQIIDYLLSGWGASEAQNFINQVDKIELLIMAGHVDFERTNRPNIRRCVLSKQVTLFYKTYRNNSVEFLRLWNNFQDKRSLNL